jgi:hypothetical protein
MSARVGPDATRVGPVLEASATGHAVAATILASNPGALLEDRGAYLRVSAPERCAVARRDIEERLGRSFSLPRDLELVMPAFQGFLRVSEDGVEWRSEAP